MLSKKGGKVMLKDHWNWLLEEVKKRKWIIYSILIGFPILVLVLGITLEGVADTLVALGTISMALAIVYIEIIKPWLQKPDIKIEFAKEKYLHREKKENNPCYYCHFMVVNSGLSQADDCEAVLEKIWDGRGKGEDHSKWPECENWFPVNLKWSAETKSSREARFQIIYPGQRRYFCDIARIDPDPKEKGKTFTFELARTFISQDTFLGKGKYKIRISVYSKNAVKPKVTEEFRIDWCGEWKETLKEMKKCLIIKML